MHSGRPLSPVPAPKARLQAACSSRWPNSLLFLHATVYTCPPSPRPPGICSLSPTMPLPLTAEVIGDDELDEEAEALR